MAKFIIIQPKTLSEADDFALLEYFGLDIEKEIREYLHELAKKTREAINENTKN